MNLIERYSNTVTTARDLSLECVKGASYHRSLNDRSEKLLQSLRDNAYIKIPFVGDFNAGKSSLINAFIGKNLLPTNITPETAVAYEMYYSCNEKLEHYRADKLIATFSLDKIKDIETEAGDIMKVYIDNDKIKELNERQIVIVDMPGIDSGIEAHNSAIVNYLVNGKGFVIVTNTDQGTLRSSTLSFIEELKQFGLTFTVLMSKTDMKPSDEVEKIYEHIKLQAKKAMGSDVYVGRTSAHDNILADLTTALDKFDAEKIVETLYKKEVDLFIQNIISEIFAKINFITSDKSILLAKIKEIEAAKEEAIKEIEEKKKLVSNTDEATQDILNKIGTALYDKSNLIAETMINTPNNTDIIMNDILAIVRPVLANSLSAEAYQYQEKLSNISVRFATVLDKFLEDRNNTFFKKILDTFPIPIGTILTNSKLQNFLKNKIGKKLGGKLLAKIFSRATPWGMAIMNLIDLIGIDNITKFFTGKDSHTRKVEKIVNKFREDLIPKLKTAFTLPISEIIEEQRTYILAEVKNQIVEKSDEYQRMIEDAEKEDNMNKEQETEYLSGVEKRLEQLQAML